MIEHFKNEETVAIQYRKHHKMVHKTYKEFYLDIHRMIHLCEESGIKSGDKVALFIFPHNYLFYVVMFAGMLLGINLVVFDSYKRKHIQELSKMEEVSLCFVQRKTKLLARWFMPNSKRINASKYRKYKPCEFTPTQVDRIVLTTFTSGTTGTPKAIHRKLSFLLQQISQIQSEINLEDMKVVFGGLPIYNLLSLFLLKTTCISKHLKHIRKMPCTSVLTTINQTLKEKQSYPNIKNVMLGGAILYKKEVEHIQRIFPNAKITYVYGASECAIIYKTTLDNYKNAPLHFLSPAQGIQIQLLKENSDGVGEIMISGEMVNTPDHTHLTGDLGRIKNGVLEIVGRKKYSALESGFYNYLFDEEIRKNQKGKAFSLYYQNKIFVVYEGKLQKTKQDVTYVQFHKLPMDLKHKTKLNYKECIKRLAKTYFTKS